MPKHGTGPGSQHSEDTEPYLKATDGLILKSIHSPVATHIGKGHHSKAGPPGDGLPKLVLEPSLSLPSWRPLATDNNKTGSF
jgi:hypothetical protein